jgi:hypothetical protein
LELRCRAAPRRARCCSVRSCAATLRVALSSALSSEPRCSAAPRTTWSRIATQLHEQLGAVLQCSSTKSSEPRCSAAPRRRRRQLPVAFFFVGLHSSALFFFLAALRCSIAALFFLFSCCCATELPSPSYMVGIFFFLLCCCLCFSSIELTIGNNWWFLA